MFSKALFKQSCKANGTMWAIVTIAVCFMLACVMLISGNGNIGEVKNSIQDTIIVKEVDSQMEKRAISYYNNASEGLEKFDELFSEKTTEILTYYVWYTNMPNQSDYISVEQYIQTLNYWFSIEPEILIPSNQAIINDLKKEMPNQSSFENIEEYLQALNKWKQSINLNTEQIIISTYTASCEELQTYIIEQSKKAGYEEQDIETQEMLGSVMYILNPNKMFDSFYTDNNEQIPEEYDITSLINHIQLQDIMTYLQSDERKQYRNSRCENGAAIFLSGNMMKEENVNELMKALSNYGVTQEKYESFNYTYDSIKNKGLKAIITYQARLENELLTINNQYNNGYYKTEEEYLNAIANIKESLQIEISSSFLSTLPQAVSDALEEVGQADLYTLIVGSIFYKLAGLLLPIIYMIMVANNLIAGQVDSGSMAYVLSTSTKRKSVVITQAVYLIGSLLAMFILTTITGCISLSIITEDVELTYGKLILLNLGAFLVLLALSGLCFFTSCLFDRSKRSMAIGGGLSIFALVAAMLGLFGSPVIPSVIRLNALNYFNYTTIISLFDVVSIMEGTTVFIYKFIILFVLGIIGYITGSYIFTKKDLPL